MFKMIDRTLTSIKLDETSVTGEMLAKMCQLLSKLGANYIEISVPVLERIGELPLGPKYILKVDRLEDLERYRFFDKYVIKSKDGIQVEKAIHEIQINDVREVPMLTRYAHLPNVRITGLDEMMCVDYPAVMKRLRETFDSPIEFCPQNSYFCATALAIEWVLSGGKSVCVSFAGVGGYAVLEEVMMAVKIIMHKKINIDLSILPEATALYEAMIGHKVNYNKAILGDNIFVVEAGIHADGINKNPITYEPYDPKTVGKVRRIVVGKHSGTSAIKMKLSEKGAKIPDHMLETILENVKAESVKRKRSLTDGEFTRIVKEVIASEKQKVYS